MNILVLAPQPFFQERGTPIAVDLMVRTLSDRGHRVDLLAYHEGADWRHPGVRLHRTPRLPFVRNIRPGFSLKKLICDFLMFWQALALARRTRPDVVHAVEEAAFMAWVIRRCLGIPYIYDMDSSLPDQMVDALPVLRPLRPAMMRLLRPVVRGALLVTPVCDALGETVASLGPRRVMMLRDVSLLNGEPAPDGKAVPATGPGAGAAVVFMYVGNLEHYQGIDLLLRSFALHAVQRPEDRLVIIGGTPGAVTHYRSMRDRLGLSEEAVALRGAQPVARMPQFFAEADVLVSPRIHGTNTPMKIYSYMDSGKPVVATDLFTHTQVLDGETAALAAPEPAAFAAVLGRVATDPAWRAALAARARVVVREKYSAEAFRKALDEIYAYVEGALAARPAG